MKPSRYYQTLSQVIGSVSEVVLFLGGFFLGKEMILLAIGLLVIRVVSKWVMSELMYKRMQAVIGEGGSDG